MNLYFFITGLLLVVVWFVYLCRIYRRRWPEPEYRVRHQDFTVTTIQHENHKLIVVENLNGLAVLHHPDCECLDEL